MKKKKLVKKKPPAAVRKKRKKRNDWRANDMIITEAFCDLLIKLQRAPSYAEVAKKIGNIDEKTVERHLKEVNFEERFKQFRAGSPKVVANLFRQAISTKNDRIIRLWLELFEGLGNNKKVDITSGGEKVIWPTNITSLSFEQLKELTKEPDNPGGKG